MQNPKQVAQNHAQAVFEQKMVAEALNIQTVAEVREVVYTSESKA